MSSFVNKLAGQLGSSAYSASATSQQGSSSTSGNLMHKLTDAVTGQKHAQDYQGQNVTYGGYNPSQNEQMYAEQEHQSGGGQDYRQQGGYQQHGYNQDQVLDKYGRPRKNIGGYQQHSYDQDQEPARYGHARNNVGGYQQHGYNQDGTQQGFSTPHASVQHGDGGDHLRTSQQQAYGQSSGHGGQFPAHGGSQGYIPGSDRRGNGSHGHY